MDKILQINEIFKIDFKEEIDKDGVTKIDAFACSCNPENLEILDREFDILNNLISLDSKKYLSYFIYEFAAYGTSIQSIGSDMWGDILADCSYKENNKIIFYIQCDFFEHGLLYLHCLLKHKLTESGDWID